MKKHVVKLLSLLMILCMVVGMVACSGSTDKETGTDNKDVIEALKGTYDITVWVSELEGVKELTEKQIDKFEEMYPGIIINAQVEGIGEGEAATQMVQNVEDGADLFCFAQDQLARLVLAGALNKLGTAAAAEVTEKNDSISIASATVDGTLYCYPMTSDNGYFMFYDKSVISEDHIDSLEDIIADCEKAGKLFSFELEGSAWYNASFFMATGCSSTWKVDTNGKFTGVTDTFNSDKGIIALKGMQKLLHSTCYNNSSAHADFAAPIPSAVVISGAWGTSVAMSALGDNFAATDLPSFTVDGQTYHLGSFSGNKLMGVKPQTDSKRAAVLQKLALFLTDEACQLERFEAFGWGPSNKVAKENEAVKKDVALSALALQSEYAIPQGQIHGSWWDIGKTYVTAAKNAAANDTAALQAALDAYTNAINGVISMPSDEKEAFTVIGSFENTGWKTDIAMTQKPEGTWYSDVPIAFVEGDEFKVRQGKSWDVAYGSNDNGGKNEANVVVETAGLYFVKLVIADGQGTITLEKTNPNVGYSVIGSMNGDSGWTIDYDMEICDDGSWVSKDAIVFEAGNEFKVRQGHSWDVSYGDGAGNCVVSEDGTYTPGTYKVKLVIVDGTATISLIAP